MNWQVIWLALLTLALVAHMVKDAAEFKKIARLETQLAELRQKLG